jgi:hypothetical protein
VAIAIEGGELVYFEIDAAGMLMEVATKEVRDTLTSRSLKLHCRGRGLCAYHTSRCTTSGADSHFHPCKTQPSPKGRDISPSTLLTDPSG